MRVCLINHPNTSNLTPLSNFIQTLLALGIDLHLIIGKFEYEHNKIYQRLKCTLIEKKVYANFFFRAINYFRLQLQIAVIITRVRKNVDVFIFFIGGDTLLLPYLCAKILRKRVLLLIAGSSIKTHKKNQDCLTPCLKILREPCLTLADRIIVYSPRLIQDYELEHYRHKILIAGEHFLDFVTFTDTTPYTDRPSLIGFIGRLSGEKGVQHFARALPAILNEREELCALIGGDGQLKEPIETSLLEAGLKKRVELPGWVSHENLPKYLNQLRLLILPSYTEGLPNIILEAMACGTPVLATPVGAIPDVIIDGETGFIMENNTPECIAENVRRALINPDLKGVADRGREHVKEKYQFKKVVERWKEVLEII